MSLSILVLIKYRDMILKTYHTVRASGNISKLKSTSWSEEEYSEAIESIIRNAFQIGARGAYNQALGKVIETASEYDHVTRAIIFDPIIQELFEYQDKIKCLTTYNSEIEDKKIIDLIKNAMEKAVDNGED